MSSVPSHDWFYFDEAAGNTCLRIDSRGPIRPFQPTPVSSQSDSARLLIRPLIDAIAIAAQLTCSRRMAGQSVRP